MEDHIFESFLINIKKNKKKNKPKAISIDPINLEHFQLEKIGKGILETEDIHALYEWSKNTLQRTAHQIDFIIKFHPDSPRYWLKGINKKDEEGKYSLYIDLERFIESSNQKKYKNKDVGFYIPDNYELAKKVLEEFKKESKLDCSKIVDNSYREIANWETKDLKTLKKFADFISTKYVNPFLEDMLKNEKVKKVVFTSKKIKFEY